MLLEEIRMKFVTAIAGLAASLSIVTAADAAVYVVDALTHSSDSGAGTGLSTVTLNAGDAFTVLADLDDLWSAGALPRWSNADGLTGDRFATGTDESGESAGTLIGQDFGLLNIGGFSAPFGSLIGQIGTGPGSYRLLGANFSGTAWASGTLVLYYWDTFTGDNAGQIAADISVGIVPEPATWAMMILGFGAAGAMLRRRRLVVLA
jgi:hypothetical protein